MKTLFKYILSCINNILKSRKIFYYSPNENNSFGKTAVKTKFGFWYVGNVLDQKDIACGILNFGLVEPAETALVLKIFEVLKQNESTCIFDVGANTGYYSLLAANIFKNYATIHSFEPVLKFVSCFQESLKINSLSSSVIVNNFALSDREGGASIFVDGTCSSFENGFGGGNLPKELVRLATLDSYAQNICPDFIKIDVEGHEYAVLNGAVNTLKKCFPVLFIEIVERLGERNYVNTKYHETFSLLIKMGYIAYRLVGDKLHEIRENSDAPDGVSMYLFLNKEKHGGIMRYLEHYEYYK